LYSGNIAAAFQLGLFLKWCLRALNRFHTSLVWLVMSLLVLDLVLCLCLSPESGINYSE